MPSIPQILSSESCLWLSWAGYLINPIQATSVAVMLMEPSMERHNGALISFPGLLCSFGLDYTGMSYLRERLEEPVSMGTEAICAQPSR